MKSGCGLPHEFYPVQVLLEGDGLGFARLPPTTEGLERCDRCACRFRLRLRSRLRGLQQRPVGMEHVDPALGTVLIRNQRRFARPGKRCFPLAQNDGLFLAVDQCREGVLNIFGCAKNGLAIRGQRFGIPTLGLFDLRGYSLGASGGTRGRRHPPRYYLATDRLGKVIRSVAHGRPRGLAAAENRPSNGGFCRFVVTRMCNLACRVSTRRKP